MGEAPETRVALGFDAAWGFAPGDQTSPAQAAAAGALVDVTLGDQRVTELRVQGISGGSGPTMLEHPAALQVAGDGVAGFFRRWSPDGSGRPSVPWKLEAYSWGGLTSSPLAAASWILLAPFMLFNLAHYMLPPQPAGQRDGDGEPRRDRIHWLADVLLRLLALTATVELIAAATSVLLSGVAWQAAGRPGMLPSWLGWYGGWATGWRMDLALVAVAAVIGGLAWISRATASKYEARVSHGQPDPASAWPLTRKGFWNGRALVSRQRAMHIAAGCAIAALITVLPPGHPEILRLVAIGLAAVVLVAVLVSIVAPFSDRHVVAVATAAHPRKRTAADRWCAVVVVVALVSVVVAAVESAWTDRRPGPQAGVLPGLTGLFTGLLAMQAALLVGLAIAVAAAAGRAPSSRDQYTAPFLKGWMAAPVAGLGVTLGGLLSAVLNIGVARALGTPVPSGFQVSSVAGNSVVIAAPVYALGAASLGLLLGAVPAAIVLGRKFVVKRREYATPRQGAPSPVALFYRSQTAGLADQASVGQPSADQASAGQAGSGKPSAGDGPGYDGNRRAIASAWAVARLVDDAGVVAACLFGGTALAVVIAEVMAVLSASSRGGMDLASGWNGLASVLALVSVLVAGWLVTLLRQAYSSSSERMAIGAVWDVATFWPRAVHPLAPPCYAERAVPELVDRIRVLTGHVRGPGKQGSSADPAWLLAAAQGPDLDCTTGLTVNSGPVLLTGYSQGAIMALAVAAQLPAEALRDVAVLTLACPARRLYGRAFPAYLGPQCVSILRERLSGEAGLAGPGGSPVRWRNLCRETDFIGSWIFSPPGPMLDAEVHAGQAAPLTAAGAGQARGEIDQASWDPAVLVPDANPTPPPLHRHSGWWPEPRVREVSYQLLGPPITPVPEPADSGDSAESAEPDVA
jgi:hypothetical protein